MQMTKKQLTYIFLALTLGVSMGIALGVTTGNVLLWVLLGIGFSVVVGLFLGSSGDK
jgi:hypothetical protein